MCTLIRVVKCKVLGENALNVVTEYSQNDHNGMGEWGTFIT